MSIHNTQDTALDHINVIGQVHGDQALWQLAARTRRVPGTNADNGTPGVYGLRTLAMRSLARDIGATGGPVPFLDPTLLDAFVSGGGADGSFTLEILGRSAQVTLDSEQRIDLTPLREQPAYQPAPPGAEPQVQVSPFLVVAGTLSISNPDALLGILPALDNDQRVDLDRDGIVYTARVPTPLRNGLGNGGGKVISSRVRLSLAVGKPTLTLLPGKFDALARQGWYAEWQLLTALAGRTRATAWTRLHFDVAGTLPSLAWAIDVKDGEMSVQWSPAFLPPKVVTVTLADQPTESQWLAPEQVLTLVPEDVRFVSRGKTLTVRAGAVADPELVYRYQYDAKAHEREQLTFAEPLPMVHAPAAVHGDLQALYGPLVTENPVLPGFLQVADGWVELPFARNPVLPDRLVSQSGTDSSEVSAHGSFLVGTRRPELQAPDALAREVPWSTRIDVPAAFDVLFEFEADRLNKAIVNLNGSAIQCRGMVWLANRAPDAHDALPPVDAEPDAFFDIVLDRAAEGGQPAPFVMEGAPGMRMIAPLLPASGNWDDRTTRRWSRAPSLAGDTGFTVDLTVLATDAPTPGRQQAAVSAPPQVRAWLHHPTLPVIGCMPATRSDPASPRPHASRALTLFEQALAPLRFINAAGMAPALDRQARQQFEAARVSGAPPALAVLSLPGIELEAHTPSSYLARGRYGLPVLDEMFARAVLPPQPGAEGIAAAAFTPAPVTALDRGKLGALWIQQGRRRANAAVEMDLMFPAGAPGAALQLAPTALAEPRVLAATATLDAAVSIDAGNIVMGTVSFVQANPAWSWQATGDELLAGPDMELDLSTDGDVVIGRGTARLLGWSFAERKRATLTVDGRGIGWDSVLKPVGDVILRPLAIEQPAGTVPRTLASSRVPLVLGGTGSAAWRLAFTDLPMPGPAPGAWTPGPFERRLAGYEAGWTWSLYEAGDLELTSLELHQVLQFAPAALKGVTVSAAGQVSGAEVEGALTLGSVESGGSGLARHAGCRVRLVFVRDAGTDMLVLDSITALDNPHGRIELDFRVEREASVIISGVSQLSALPVLEDGVLELQESQLAITLFGNRTSIELGRLAAVAQVVPYEAPAPDEPLVMGLTLLNLDLASARVGEIGFTAMLRTEVEVEVMEMPPDSDNPGVHASVGWFGNDTSWKIHVDDMRRTMRLWEPASEGVEVFPYVQGGRIDTGMLCMTLDAPRQHAQFSIGSHFFEAIFQVSGQLQVSHLMHANGELAPVDVFRFDGTLARESLVTWPDLRLAPVGEASSAKVQFAKQDVVVHSASFELSDHRLPGNAVYREDDSRGLALRAPTAGQAAAVWLAEATHTLSWRRGGVDGQLELERRVHCLQRVQLWSGKQLGEALKGHGQQYAFTASHEGMALEGFPNAGVRKVEQAFAGLFQSNIAVAIAKLDERWLVLGNMTTLCPGGADTGQFLPLHLPFIGAFGETDQLRPLRVALGVPEQTAASSLRMSRHDLLGLPMRVDASMATPAGILAGVPPDMAIPFALAALPAETLSGEALRTGWSHGSGGTMEAGLHVEQPQFPGAPTGRPKTPHAFPRAAVMLDFFRSWKANDALPALSVLVREPDSGVAYPAKIHTVQIQPRPTAKGAGSYSAAAELIVGSAQGLQRRVVERGFAGAEYARHLLAIAMEVTREPSFLVLREAVLDSGGARACKFTGVELPARAPDQLAFAARALRPRTGFATDGRLTWPEQRSEGSDRKRLLAAVWGARRPFQHAGLGVAGVRGSVQAAREGGEVFGFAPISGKPEGALAAPGMVWLQEWEKAVFAAAPVDPEDAPPSAHDSPVSAWPLAPTSHAVAAAIGRIDPAAQATGTAIMQTYLPPLIDDVDLPSRLGTMTERGLRMLRTWDDGKGRDDAPALAGAAQTRSMRTPRPVAIPPNGSDCRRWGRTVGWYGEPAVSCLALQGAWDMLAADPGLDGIPPWCILIGKPSRARLDPLAVDPEQGWSGAVLLACAVLVLDANGKAERHTDPARFILDVLFQAGASVRAGLRCDGAWLPFDGVSAVNGHALEFFTRSGAARPSAGMSVRFECGWLVGSGPFEAAGAFDLLLPAYTAPLTLDPTAFRGLSLPLAAARNDQFRLPLVERTIFFSDPAFDAQLSRVKGLSDSVRIGAATLGFWIDRPSLAPGETVVMRASWSELLPPKLTLSASVKRDGIGATVAVKLDFQFEPQRNVIEIVAGSYLALPLSLLAEGGRGLVHGDIVRFELQSSTDAIKTAVLFLPVRTQSALAPPQAQYSLIGIDEAAPRAWCASHSATPQPEGLVTHVQGEELTRRALFKWRSTQPFVAAALGFSICKVDLTTEATHVPTVVETELPLEKPGVV